jgi:hypothetical protein
LATTQGPTKCARWDKLRPLHVRGSGARSWLADGPHIAERLVARVLEEKDGIGGQGVLLSLSVKLRHKKRISHMMATKA